VTLLRLLRAPYPAAPALDGLDAATAEAERFADDLKIVPAQPAEQFADYPRLLRNLTHLYSWNEFVGV